MNSITVQITHHPAGGQPVGTELSLHPSYGNWSTTLASRPEHNQTVLGTGSVGISGTRLLAIGDSITVLEAEACSVTLEGFSLESTPAGSTGSGSIVRLTPGSWVSLVGSLLEVAVKSFGEALGMDPITRSLHLSESERDRLEFALNYAAGQSAEYGDGVVKTIFAELMEKRQYSRDYVRYAPVSLGAPPRQNSCRPNRTMTLGAQRERVGAIRTGIQGPGGGTHAAAGERIARGGVTGDRGERRYVGAVASRGVGRARQAA